MPRGGGDAAAEWNAADAAPGDAAPADAFDAAPADTFDAASADAFDTTAADVAPTAVSDSWAPRTGRATRASRAAALKHDMRLRGPQRWQPQQVAQLLTAQQMTVMTSYLEV